jgi:serine/threonine-protein kinase
MTMDMGSLIGQKFRLEKKLVEDETSVVVAARHIAENRLVAIRVLTSGTSDVRFLSRFARAATIQSDHVPQLFDVGTMPDGRPYLVMEYLEGNRLEDIVANGPIAITDAVDYVMQACDAVAAAHAVGITHRKLRTSSLFLAKGANGESLVRILNFATVTGSESGALPAHKAEYLAPEQIADPKHVDTRCDIWALGVVLYELLTGRRPFDGRSLAKVNRRILREEPKQPSSIRSEIAPPLEVVVLRCLQKEPAKRYRSVADLANALSPFASSLTRHVPVHLAHLTAERRKENAASPGAPSRPALPAVTPPPPEADVDDEAVTVLRPSGEEEVGFRKVTKDGRIETLDSDAAAVSVRAKRVAAEAAALAQTASANREEEPREDTHSTHRVTIRPAGTSGRFAGDPPDDRARATKRLIFVLVVLVAAIIGLSGGVLLRILDARN